jgi:ABC-type polar amino acid transport system ATPase subunit
MDHGEIVDDCPVAEFFSAKASPRAAAFLSKIIRH